MALIRTVLGDISPSSLGHCQCHEHIFLTRGMSALINPALCMDHLPSSMEELEDYYQAGGRAIVDAQPTGCGRDAQALAILSQGSGVHIVASTGFHKGCFYPRNHWLWQYRTQEAAQLFIQEIAVGMAPSCDTSPPQLPLEPGPRAGQIKTALDREGLTAPYRRLFRAAALASNGTGAPIMVHIEAGSDPISVADFLQDQGVPPQKMIFCHMDRAVADFSVHTTLYDRGIYLEYDTIAREKYHSDTVELDLICRLIQQCGPQRLLLSLDTTAQRLSRYGGNTGLSYLIEQFLPQLEKRGLYQLIPQLMVDNPAQALSIDQKHPVG